MNDFILWKEIEMLGLLMISSVAASQLGNALTRLNAASFPSFFLNPRALAAANPSTKGQAKKGFSSSELATARREALSRPTFTRLLLFDTVTSNNLNTSGLTSTKVNLNYYFCCRMYMKVIVVIVRRRIHRVLNACNECVKEFTLKIGYVRLARKSNLDLNSIFLKKSLHKQTPVNRFLSKDM